MAIDEAMAIAFSQNKTGPTVRVYRWASPVLTLGSFQKIDAVNETALESIPRIRRMTGGRAILHDRDLTYSVIGATDDPLFTGGIKKTFYAIAQGLLAALHRMGVPAEIHQPRKNKVCSEREQGPFCATSCSWYEIVASEKKLIGSAQRRWPHHFLQHGSLPLEQSPLEKTLYSKGPITLRNLIAPLPPLSIIEEAIRIGFETAWSVRFEKQSLTADEEEMADRLVLQKYGNPAWNNHREKTTPSVGSLREEAGLRHNR